MCVQISPEITFTVRRDDLQRLGCAGFLTEFDISLTLSSESLLHDTLEQADFFLQVGGGCSPQYVCVFCVSPQNVQHCCDELRLVSSLSLLVVLDRLGLSPSVQY